MATSYSYKKSAPMKQLTLPEDKSEASPMDLELLAKTRAEYKNNKVRKQERWFDWTPPTGDALDELIQKRRDPDPVPFDVNARAYTPYKRRFEMDAAYSGTARAYKATKEASKKTMDGKYRPTSIFGGQQATPGVLPGRGWGDGMGFAKPPSPGTDRNAKFENKYAGSSFPDKYAAFADKEMIRLRRKARGL